MTQGRFLEDVCATFDLGTIRGTPRLVEGGLSNRLYHLATNRGEYAVKRMVANAEAAGFKANVEGAFAVERLAHAAGIAMPAPVPVPGTSEALARVMERDRPCWVCVHEWVFAEQVSTDQLQPGDVDRIGAILAALHRLPPPTRASTAKGSAPPPARDWRTALARRTDDGSLFAAIELLEEIARRGHAAPASGQAWSHRDLDAKNLLRDASGELIVIDWDAAGPIDPRWDVVGVAMDWSGVREGRFSPQSFEAMLDAYALAGGQPGSVGLDSFAGWSEGVLDWLWFNLERSGASDPGERRLGESEVGHSARFLPVAAAWIMDRSLQR